AIHREPKERDRGLKKEVGLPSGRVLKEEEVHLGGAAEDVDITVSKASRGRGSIDVLPHHHGVGVWAVLLKIMRVPLEGELDPALPIVEDERPGPDGIAREARPIA